MIEYRLEDVSSPSAQINTIIKNRLDLDVYTCYLAKVKDRYMEKGSARVDVALVNKFFDENKKEIQQTVKNVPVGSLGGKMWTLSYPIQVGDIGLVIITKYDNTTYFKTKDEGITENDKRFSVTNAIYIPMALALQPEITDNLELKSEKTRVTITPDGEIEVENEKDISITNRGNITLVNQGGIELSNDKDIEISNGGNITVNNQSNIEVTNQGNTTINNNGSLEVTSGSVSVESSDVKLGNVNNVSGVVTQQCYCALTGLNHPMASLTVKASI